MRIQGSEGSIGDFHNHMKMNFLQKIGSFSTSLPHKTQNPKTRKQKKRKMQ